jgi:hypothetical protein
LTSGVGTALYRAPEQESAGDKSGQQEQELLKKALKKTGNRISYNTKADMFSLGIILFEMSHEPFATGMERVQSLLSLRKNSGTFLESVTRIPDNLKSIIASLVQTDPLSRPEAVELQNSPLMPPRIQLDKSYLDEVLAAITVPYSDASRRVVSTLFQRQDKIMAEHEDVTYDQELHSSILRSLKLELPDPKDSSTRKMRKEGIHTFLLPHEIQESFRHIAETVFGCHGATKFNPSNLLPKYSMTISDNDDASHGMLLHSSRSTWNVCQKRQEVLSSSDDLIPIERPVELMTSTGTTLSLPMELVTPYARAVARLGLHSASRYHIDSVYYERELISGTVGGRHPFMSVEAVYDVVREDYSLQTSASTQHIETLPPQTRALISVRRGSIEIEVIATALDLVDRIDPKRLIGQRYLRIGDCRLGNAILDLCAAPYPRTKALRALSAICDEALAQKLKNSPFQDLFLHSCSLLAEIGLPDDVQRALNPFIKVITSISNPRLAINAINEVPYLLTVSLISNFDSDFLFS